jgi:hypothetical protein
MAFHSFNSLLMLLQIMFKTCFTMLQTQNAFVIHIEKQVLTSVLNLCREKLTLRGLTL